MWLHWLSVKPESQWMFMSDESLDECLYCSLSFPACFLISSMFGVRTAQLLEKKKKNSLMKETGSLPMSVCEGEEIGKQICCLFLDVKHLLNLTWQSPHLHRFQEGDVAMHPKIKKWDYIVKPHHPIKYIVSYKIYTREIADTFLSADKISAVLPSNTFFWSASTA